MSTKPFHRECGRTWALKASEAVGMSGGSQRTSTTPFHQESGRTWALKASEAVGTSGGSQTTSTKPFRRECGKTWAHKSSSVEPQSATRALIQYEKELTASS